MRLTRGFAAQLLFRYMWAFPLFAGVCRYYGNVICVWSEFTGAGSCGMVNVHMLKNVDERAPPCETPVLNWRCIDGCSLNIVYAMNIIMVFGMCVCRTVLVSLCMFTVSKALLMSRVTVSVRTWGVLKPLTIVVLMLCSAVIVEWRFFKPCCVLICCMLFVMYGRRLFSRILTMTDRSEIGLYEVPMFMFLLSFGMGIMFANFHIWGMMLYMLLIYVSPRGPMCFRCLMLNLSGPVELLFGMFYCLLDLSLCWVSVYVASEDSVVCDVLYAVCNVCVNSAVLSRGAMYMFAIVMCFVLFMLSLTSCSSVLCWFMAIWMSVMVHAMLFLISVISPPPLLCSRSVLTTASYFVSFISWIVIVFSWVTCMMCFSFSSFFLYLQR